jgi:hypothetical protein
MSRAKTPKAPRDRNPERRQKFQAITKGGVTTLVRDKPISEMRGFLRGMPITGFREKKDRICHRERL